MRKATATLCFLILVLSIAPQSCSDENGEEEPLGSAILKVGTQSDLQTSNLLDYWTLTGQPEFEWTGDILRPVYGPVAHLDPVTERPIPYLLKGIDADENGVFDLDEYGIFSKVDGTDPFEVTAYYDFNGVLTHDGIQMTIHDLLFSYHVRTLCPLSSENEVLKDNGGLPGSNYSTTKWLNVWPATDVWDPSIPVGPDIALTFALHFSQHGLYLDFIRVTLSSVVPVPRHIWEGTGKVCLQAVDGVCNNWRQNIHSDFGYAYDMTTKNGVPDSNPSHFDYFTAENWSPAVDEVVGVGPFAVSNWTVGTSVEIDRFEDYKADALDCVKVGTPPVCQGEFFAYMHKPYIDGMEFLPYSSEPDAVSALHAGDIDIISWPLPRSYADGLLSDSNISISTILDNRFYYLGYNMRSSPLGYPGNDPSQGDDGYYLRKAISHLIDKQAIVTSLLQGYGMTATQPIFPQWERWLNASVTTYEHNLTIAQQVLDDYYTVGGLGLGYNASGFRNLPTIGDRAIEIICPKDSYDPVRAGACDMIAENMTAVNLNATANHLDMAVLFDRINNLNMEMWVLGWIIGSEPPLYYGAFFHSSNATGGQNYNGFNNATFDVLIDNVTAEYDTYRQEDGIKQCSGLLADALPYDTLYFVHYLEAFREDRFINWTIGVEDSIFVDSFWSWIGIHPPTSISVEIAFLDGNVVNENETLLFEVLVTDGIGNPVDNAVVTISCSPVGPTIVPDSGLTVGGSLGPVMFAAPEIVGSNRYFAVTANASKWGFTGNDTELVLVVNSHPPTLTGARLSGTGYENVTIEWALSEDDGQGDLSVTGYEILTGSAYDPDGMGYFLLGSVANGTAQYEHIGAGESDPNRYFYLVCAMDSGDNSSCSNEQAAKFNRPLTKGPNLMSVPLIQINEAIEPVLQTVEYDKAWYYDSSSREWKWYMKSKGYRKGLWNANHTMGLWVNVTSDCNLTVAGIVPAHTTIHLYDGWNLVSFPSFNTSYSVSDLKAEIGATRVEGYDLAPPNFLRVLGDAEVLLAGESYWVRVQSEVDWIVEVS